MIFGEYDGYLDVPKFRKFEIDVRNEAVQRHCAKSSYWQLVSWESAKSEIFQYWVLYESCDKLEVWVCFKMFNNAFLVNS